MTTLTADRLGKRAGEVRRAVNDGNEVVLTFHGQPYACVISLRKVKKQLAELQRLRAEVKTLRRQLNEGTSSEDQEVSAP